MRDAGDSPMTTENYPARNINSAEVEKPKPTACYLFVYFFITIVTWSSSFTNIWDS